MSKNNSTTPAYALRVKRKALFVRLKYFLLLAVAVAFLCASVSAVSGGTLAWLTFFDSSLSHFTIGEVDIRAYANEQGGVSVENTGNVAVYVRLRAIPNVKDNYGALCVSDESSSLGVSGEGWVFSADGYYYYPSAIEPNASTSAVYAICSDGVDLPDGYRLTLAVVAEAIQMRPASIVDAAWASHPPYN